MRRRSPQEKKRLSYLKDGRNLYGENDKSSRKNIPRNRQLKHRAERHRAAQALTIARSGLDEDVLQRRLSGRPPSSWWKRPDVPLGETLEFRLNKRVERGNADPEQTRDRIRRIRQRLT